MFELELQPDLEANLIEFAARTDVSIDSHVELALRRYLDGLDDKGFPKGTSVL